LLILNPDNNFVKALVFQLVSGLYQGFLQNQETLYTSSKIYIKELGKV